MKQEAQQISPSQEPGGEVEAPQEKNWPVFLLCSYLYFLQGIILASAGTMPFIYPVLPSYDVLAIFSACSLPFSFKFLMAPFLEKFSFVSYGKRKTWIIISQIGCGISILVSSLFTQQENATLLAIIFFVSQIFIATQDIALDGLALKQLKSPEQVSMIQCYAQSFGSIVFSMLLLKLTNLQFALSVGLTSPISTPDVVLKFLSIFLFAPAIYLHFFFKETVLSSQIKGTKLGFCQIVSHFKLFFKISQRYCRIAIFLVLSTQGFNFFTAGYDYEMVKAGFSRNTSNTISNLITFPVIIATFYMGTTMRWIGSLNKSFIISCYGTLVIFLYLLIVFPQDVGIYAVTNLVIEVLSTFRFFMVGVLINEFPLCALSGMFMTMTGCFANIGKLTPLHTKLIGMYGWRNCTYVGLGIQLILNIGMSFFMPWMDEGTVNIPEEIQNDDESQNIVNDLVEQPIEQPSNQIQYFEVHQMPVEVPSQHS